MTLDADSSEVLPDPVQQGVDLLLRPLWTFLGSMEAARELVEFIAANRRSLGSVEEAFTAEALRVSPAIPEALHREAATLVHRAIHDGMDARAAITSAGGSDQDADAAQDERLAVLRADLLALTGRPADFDIYGQVWARASSRPDKAGMLLKSLLISTVSDFEVLIYAVVRSQLTMRPEILRSDEQKYSMRDLEGFASLDEFRAFCAERMAESLLRGGFDDWMDWFSKRHKLDVPGVTDRPAGLVEIFQRRHLLVHNDGVVNSSYRSKLPDLANVPSLGRKLTVRPKYLLASIDELTTAALKLVHGLFLKLVPGDVGMSAVEHSIGSMTYELLKDGRYRVVEQANVWNLSFAEEPGHRLVAMVNVWLSRKLMHGTEAISSEVEAWKTGTLAPVYRLVQLALLDRDEEAYLLAKHLLESGSLSEESWADWPVLGNLRAYEAALGTEPLVQGTAQFAMPHQHVGDQSAPEPTASAPLDLN